MGSKTQTQTTEQKQQSGPLPQYAKAYSQLLGQTQNVVQNAENDPNLRQQVAGFTQPQQQAFGQVQSNQGNYQSSLNNAQNAVAAGVQPITTQSIMSNPLYQQQVQAINASGQNALGQAAQVANSNAALSGALTGDRSQIALGNSLAPIEAQTQQQLANAASTTFGQALQGSEASAQNALTGANIYGNLGGLQQQYANNDVNNLLGIGNLQQQQQQNVYNANTANAALPLQLQSYLNSQATGLGSAAGTKTTGTGTTSTPSNNFGQLLGAGLAIAAAPFSGGASLAALPGLAAKAYGGRVGYAPGGIVVPPPVTPIAANMDPSRFGSNPLFPASPAQHGGIGGAGAMPSLAQQSAPTQSNGMSDMINQYKQASSALNNAGSAMTGVGNYFNTTTDPASGWATTVSPSSMSGWGNFLGFNQGGMVRRGYDDGGLVDDGSGGYMGVGSGLAAALPQPQAADYGTQGAPYSPPMGLGASGVAPPPQAAPAYSPPPSTGVAPSNKDAWYNNPLLQMGLGMMAAGPSTGVKGIGGAFQSLAHSVGYGGQSVIAAQANQRRIDLEAQRLQQEAQAEQARQKLAQQEFGVRQPLIEAQTQGALTENQMHKLALGQTQASAEALNSPDTIKPYIGTPYEAVARAAIASNNPEQLANINKEMMQYGMLPMGATGAPKTTDDTGQDIPLDDYLKQIPDPGMRGKVGAVLRGEDTLAAISSRNPAYGAAVQRFVYGYDPTFSPVDQGVRISTRKSLGDHKAGSLGAYSDSIGKMSDHLNLVAKASEKLDTTPIIQWNRATQTFETQAGDPASTNFGSAANVYMHELAKVLKGGNAAPTDSDMEGLAANFNKSMSPAQLRGVLNNWDHASRAAIESTDATTQRAFGKAYNPAKDSVITPYAQKKLEALDKNPWLHPESVKPVQVKTPEEAAKLPKGTAFQTPDGRIFPNQ